MEKLRYQVSIVRNPQSISEEKREQELKISALQTRQSIA